MPYMGKAIIVNGVAATADGAVQTYFSATPAQRADPTGNYLLNVQPPAPIVPGMELRDQNRLEQFATPNGSAQPVYPVEEWLIGGASRWQTCWHDRSSIGVSGRGHAGPCYRVTRR